MPHANPERCLESAARHLFRHINDIDALRRNPLVRPFVGTAKERDEVATLRQLQSAIIAISPVNAPSVERRSHAADGRPGRSWPPQSALMWVSGHWIIRRAGMKTTKR